MKGLDKAMEKGYNEGKANADAALASRVEVVGAEKQNCEECFEPLVFALRDSKGNSFSVGLLTMLRCILVAENEELIPRFPKGWWTWWSDVIGHYNMDELPPYKSERDNAESEY